MVIPQKDPAAEIPPVAPNIYELDKRGRPELLGGHCPACGAVYFPTPERCCHCQGAIEIVSLGSEGTIYSYTTVRTRPPYGLPLPYSVAMIDLKLAPLRIFCLLDPGPVEKYSIGQPVTLVISQIGVDPSGQPCIRPNFTPSES